jgi:diguanylate cyclase (GGDEF)-like protein
MSEIIKILVVDDNPAIAYSLADILARIGGDEFVVLAVDVSMEKADDLTNHIQSILNRRNQQGDWPYQLSLSLGIAHYDPEAPCTINELIAQADGLMYQKKQEKKRKAINIPLKRKMEK